MKVVIASDKWRGTFTSAAAGEAMRDGVLQAAPGAEVVVVPLADGGEGTLEVVLNALPGARIAAEVHGPLGEPVRADWGLLPDGRALVESAAAAGLSLLPAGRRDPLVASTRGVGELIAAALDHGASGLVLALGGSATVDGGCGMARALGFRFLDASGGPLKEGGGALAGLAAVDASGADPRLRDLEAEAWCDVASPLLGPRGAARIFAPQKGAGPEAVERLEAGLARLAEVLDRDRGAAVAGLPGAGAAGGLGAGAAAFLGARLASGAGRLLDLAGLAAHLEGADLVLTGEGRHEPDAMPGKLPDAVRARAASRGIPCGLICGERAEGGDPRDPAPLIRSGRDLHPPPGGPLRAGDLAALAAALVRDRFS